MTHSQNNCLFVSQLRRLRSTGTCLENIKLNSFATLAVREIILTILRLLMKFKRRQRSKRSQNTASSKKRNSRISCNCRHFWKKEAFCTRVLETTRVSWTFVSSYMTSYFVLSQFSELRMRLTLSERLVSGVAFVVKALIISISTMLSASATTARRLQRAFSKVLFQSSGEQTLSDKRVNNFV